MDPMYATLIEVLQSNRTAAVVTVIEAIGSTPREAGAKMLVYPDGTTVGTVGGGASEAAAIQDALAALREGRPRLVEYSLRERDEEALGVCGGTVRMFIEVLGMRPTLVIVGAGHVAIPLAQLGTLLEFHTIVYDDRTEFANKERFLSADEVRVGPMDRVGELLAGIPNAYVVIITRSHKHDETVLRQALAVPCAYVGVIGSRNKVRHLYDRLVAEGISPEALAKVHMPIGLDLGGGTPAEIALSIMAEIQAVRYNKGGEQLSLRGNPALAQGVT